MVNEYVANDKRQIDSSWGKNGNKYQVGNYCYPEDATGSNDLQHVVVFYINVRSNGKISKEQNNRLILDIDTDKLNEGKLTKGDLVKAAAATSAVGIGMATGAGAISGAMKSLNSSAVSARIASGAGVRGVIGGAIKSVVSETASAAAKSAGVGLVLTAGVATAASLFEPSKMYRLRDAITLAVQEAPRVSYKIKYDEYDAGTVMGAANVGSLMSGDSARVAALGLLKTPNIVGAPDFAKAMKNMAGSTPNPFKTVLFESVDLRTFTFKYKFMPKSQKEAQNVLNIIKTFKYHMHPEFSADKLFLIHPSEFNIVHYFKGKENSNWHKISTCVLKEMDLDEGAEQLASFSDGMSVEINMSLTFLETEMMTKERIDEGY